MAAHRYFPLIAIARRAGVAQLVEQTPCKRQVRGSSPCAGTIINKGLSVVEYVEVGPVSALCPNR